MDDVTSDFKGDVSRDVTDESTDDLTNDLARARHISDWIVNCCRMNSSRNIDYEIAFVAAFVYSRYSDRVPVITGSTAELYIDPGHTCIGDADLMILLEKYVIVCDGPSVDSIDVDETFEFCQIDTSGCPNGYVHLISFGKPQFDWETEKYEYCVSDLMRLNLWASYSDYKIDRHGPSLYIVAKGRLSHFDEHFDLVPYIRFLAWPSVAQSWISRDRHHAWPSTALVSEVQRNGCDLVQVAHRDYKDDESLQRYSFSRAEVTLLRSWTPVQQLVYHLLRYFAKQIIIREWKDEDEVVCTYHIKTLMLWACERKSPVWWKSNCVIVLCSKLLETFMKWIKKKMCPHYFIPEWNLFDYTMKESRRLDAIGTLGIYTNIKTLSEWFRIHYLSKVFGNTKSFFSFLDFPKRQRMLDAIAASNRLNEEFRGVLEKLLDEKYYMALLNSHEFAMILHYGFLHWTATQFYMLIYSKNVAPDFHILNLAVASLRLAWNISGMRESELSNHELLDVLSEVVLKLSAGRDTWKCSPPYNIPFKQCSKWYFIKGVRSLSIYCNKHSLAYCLWVKTCKRYFKSALRIQDEYSESIHDACHVYLSALYYVSGKNEEKMTQHILEAKNGISSPSFFKQQILSHSSMLFVDTVAHVCGFCLLFDHVLQNKKALPEMDSL